MRTRDDAIRRRADAEEIFVLWNKECLDMFFSEESLVATRSSLKYEFQTLMYRTHGTLKFVQSEEINRSILAEHRASVTERKRIIDEGRTAGSRQTMASSSPGALEKLQASRGIFSGSCKCPECEADVRIVGTKPLPVTSQEHPHESPNQ